MRPHAVRIANGECGAMATPQFGTATRTTAAIDPKILNGWNIRPNDWQIGASIQQQVLPRVSVEVGYFRALAEQLHRHRQPLVSAVGLHAFASMRLSIRACRAAAATRSAVSTTSPRRVRSRCGNNITLTPAMLSNGERISALQRHAGQRQRAREQGPDVPGRRQYRQDGPGQLRRARRQLPELTINALGNGVAPLVGPTNPYCHTDPGFITKLTGLGCYIVPKIDVLIAGTFRSDQGAPLPRDWNAPVSVVAAALGRPAAAAATTMPIDLVAPGQVWGDRVNELDFRFAQDSQVRRTRGPTSAIDIYNIINSAAMLTYNQTYIPARRQRRARGWCRLRCCRRGSSRSARRSTSRVRVGRPSGIRCSAQAFGPAGAGGPEVRSHRGG